MNKHPNKAAQSGQGMTEYIIIVALIAVAAIAVTQLFGATVRNQVAGVAMEVAGKNGTAAIEKAGKAAEKAKEVAEKDKDLATYGGQAESAKIGN